jgi:AraC-like DNA-binding protein
METDKALRVWRDEIGRRLLSMEFRPLSNKPFRAAITPVFGHEGVRAVRQSVPAGVLYRDAELVRQGAQENYAIVYSRKGEFDACLERREVHLGAGQATLLDGFQAASGGAAWPHTVTIVQVPMYLVRAEVPNIDLLLARPIHHRCGGLRLLKGYLNLIEQKSFVRLSPEVAEAVARHIKDLFVLAVTDTNLEAAHDRLLDSLQMARLELAIDYISKHYCEHDLSLGRVARHLNISTRYLELLFERSGQTYTARVLALRLFKAHGLLLDPGASDLKVSDIALSTGFSDQSYFNKRFRQHFGDTPTSARADMPRRGRVS